MAASSDESTPPPSPNFSSLPVMALKDKIVSKILENRVTLIIGETGCGKSSQVPQFLLQEGMEPILCTQPRRFAVVAVARMVAKARGSEVGEEVGYHIGHSKVLSERSKIVFKTAGVLLDEMRDKGMAALGYKVIILDEVHERSVESDLVLACVKQFLLKNNDLRVVLMSATADISRYRDYFKELGRDERVEVLAIPTSTQQTIFQKKVLYLEQVNEALGIESEPSSETCYGLSLSNGAEIKPEEHKLIHQLVLHIHENEPDLEKSILVFLPTYYSLEQQWSLLKPFSSFFKVYILHRSIDTDQALMAMKIWKSHRKVILATNIAESSVTIPGVSFVIDSCRSLQVFWDNVRKKDAAELVWVSKSQAEQRKGRTGRTCDGQIYRLVSRSFFNKLSEHEQPSILRLSLRQQVLLIGSAESKAINDPKVLLQKAMDPPDPEVVDDALNLLVHIKALIKSTTHRGRYEPTYYGRLLASISLSFDAAHLILKFGDIGMLREGILIGILMDQQPLPIFHPFGQDFLFKEYVESYFGKDNENMVLTGRKEIIFMGNLCAYQFWQRVFKDKHRLEQLKQLFKSDEPNDRQLMYPKLEEEWCSFHNLLQNSLHHVSNIYEDIISTIHRYRPSFLSRSNGLPTYYDPYEFEHTCLLESLQKGVMGENPASDEKLEKNLETRTCIALPFVDSHHFKAVSVAEKLAAIIKEIRIQYTEDTSSAEQNTVDNKLSYLGTTELCRFFVSGSCNKGSECSFSHSLQAKRPVCKFFLSYKGCRNGESCFFSHDLSSSVPSIATSSSSCSQEDDQPDPSSFLSLIPTSSDKRVLILDDTDFHFSSNLCHHCDPTKIISTTCVPQTSIFDNYLGGVKIMWGLDHPYQTLISGPSRESIPWSQVQCVLWFANFSNSEGMEGQKSLLQKFFEYLAIRILGDSLYHVRLVLTMNSLRFSQLKVEQLARECFFFLTKSFQFDESSFGVFPDKVATKKSMNVSRPVSYVFDIHPPSDIQFGDYASKLHNFLHSD
ncbi:RNA helicase [Ranunculus cassubicifolius]